MLTGLVTSCVGTALYNTLLNKKYKGREEVEEDVSSYLIALRKREDTGIWKRKHYIPFNGELGLEENANLSQDIVQWLGLEEWAVWNVEHQ